MIDVVIVGAGPAGLTAALVLARCRRNIRIFDGGLPRNRYSGATHLFFTRDGVPPSRLLRVGRAQLGRYGVAVDEDPIIDIERRAGTFAVRTASTQSFTCRFVLLATGMKDRLPDLPGFASKYGKCIWHCPYCDGYEARDRPLAVLTTCDSGIEYVTGLRAWSRDLVLLTNGDRNLPRSAIAELAACGIPWSSKPIARLVGARGQLERIVFSDRSSLERRGMFFHLGCAQSSDLPARLGCRFDQRGHMKIDRHGHTSLEGIYAAGDNSGGDELLVAGAVADATRTAIAIHKRLGIDQHADESIRVRRYLENPSVLGMQEALAASKL